MAHTLHIDDCDICGTERQADYAIKTGVSAYGVCRACLDSWMASDGTREALRELMIKRGTAAAMFVTAEQEN